MCGETGTLAAVTRYVKKLRGELETTYSTRMTEPSLHLDPTCPGLERVPDDARATRMFRDVHDLALEEGTRLCRMCTLEAVLRSTLRPARGDRSRTYVTFSAEPLESGPFPGYGSPTPSGRRRITRIAKRTGMQCEDTGDGLIIHGWTDPRGVRILERNLRTLRIHTPGTREQLEILWTLVRDGHSSVPEPPQLRELWQAAQLLTA